jgi:hypothetical protein
MTPQKDLNINLCSTLFKTSKPSNNPNVCQWVRAKQVVTDPSSRKLSSYAWISLTLCQAKKKKKNQVQKGHVGSLQLLKALEQVAEIRSQWFTSVIPAIWEVEIGRMEVQKASETPSQSVSRHLSSQLCRR